MNISTPLWDYCRWNDDIIHGTYTNNLPSNETVIFPASYDINKRLYLYHGDICKIPCSIMIVAQNEMLSDQSEHNPAIFLLGGPTLEHSVEKCVKPITTGSCQLIDGGNLPCDHVIFAIGPRYHVTYATAADNALHFAYRSSLVLAAETLMSSAKEKTIIISCLYLQNKKYPRFAAAQVALRTLRRFLEKPISSIFDKVMIHVGSLEDLEIYSTLLTAYFPRTVAEEESQRGLISPEVGNEWGEIINPERQYQVGAGPRPTTYKSTSQARPEELRRGQFDLEIIDNCSIIRR